MEEFDQPNRPAEHAGDRPAPPAGGERVTISVGGVIGRAYDVFMKNPGLFLMLAAIAAVPEILFGGGPEPDPEDVRMTDAFGSMFFSLVTLIAECLFQGAAAYGVYRILRGKKTGAAEAVSRGMSRIFPLVVASFLMVLGVFFGILFFVVPGMLFLCMWSVAVPACVVERLGAVASMRRSGQLTKGHRLMIFGLYVLLIVATLAIDAVFGLILPLLLPFSLQSAAATVLLVPIQAFGIVVFSLLYYDLRVAKEGLSIDMIANVFD